MKHILSLARRCVEDYNMIEEGDRIAVGVSGGKDSLALLVFLAELRKYHNKSFDIEAITIDMGLGMDYSGIRQLCESLDVPYTVVETQIGPIIFDHRKEKNPCSMCSKMRRGALNQALLDRGMNKLALGHHFDDAVETFMMSLMFEGRISCFKPVTYMSRADVWQIRPMIYASEDKIAAVAEALQLPIVENPCPADTGSKRYEIKQLIRSLEKDFPDLRSKVFGSMQRLPLEGWQAAPLSRTKGKDKQQ